MAQLLQHLINGIAAGTIYALVALGYTMVYGVLKLINFAHGDVMMVGVYAGYAAAYQLGANAQATFLGVLLVFMLSMGACALIGFAIERFAYRPLREKPRLTALITAIGISFALSYGFQLDFASTGKSYSTLNLDIIATLKEGAQTVRKSAKGTIYVSKPNGKCVTLPANPGVRK